MLSHDIDARDNHPILVRVTTYSATLTIHFPTADDLADGAFCSALFTSQDNNGITLPYLHHYLLAYCPTLIAHRITVNKGDRRVSAANGR